MESKLNDILNITRIDNITTQELMLATEKWETIKHVATKSMEMYVVCALDDAKDRVGL